MTARPLAALVRKESRALVPLTSAGAVMLVGVAALGPAADPAGLLVFAVATAAVGAWSIGHDYAERTLAPLLLAQPVGRRMLFAVKLGVLATALIVIAGVAEIALPAARQLAGSAPALPWFLSSAVLSALCLAPALTMLSRSALGGTAFTLAIPLALWLGSYLVPTGTPTAAGIVPDDLPASTLPVLAPVFGLLWMAGSTLGWHLFERLEAVEGGQAFAAWRSLAHTAPRRSAGALRALIAKELRLQTMAFVISAVFIGVWLGLRAVNDDAVSGASPLLPAVLFHGLVIALLVGSLASAEERQLGTIDWQLLQPMSRRVQWAVKVTVALAVSLTLAVGLPAALSALWPPHGAEHLLLHFPQVVVVAALTLVAVYASSLAGSGLAALLLSLTLVAMLTLGGVAATRLTDMLHVERWGYRTAVALSRRHLLSPDVVPGLAVAVLGVAALLVVVPVLRLAYRNHGCRPAPGHDYWRQASVIGTSLTAAMVLVAFTAPFSSVAFRVRVYGPAVLWTESPHAYSPQRSR